MGEKVEITSKPYLSLLDFPSLNFYQFTDEVATMRQAARRAWRIGQHRKCTIRYYIYSGTYEMVQFKRMMAKRSHAMLLEGRLERSDIAAFVEQDSKSASTFSIAACLGNVEDLSQKWQSLADKDVPQGVLMLEEEKFQAEIKNAMQRLASETRRLAGVPEPIVHTEFVVDRPIIEREEEVGDLFDQPSLFDFIDHSVPSQPSLFTDEEAGEQLITFGQMRKQMGMTEKAKRVKKKDQISDDQLLLFAL